MGNVHGSCGDIWDHVITGIDGPMCEGCRERLSRSEYYASR